MCARFVDMGAPVKIQVKNGFSKLFNFRGHTIDVSYQAVFILKDSGLRDEEGNKKNVSDPLTASQRRSGRFLSFMMRFHPDQTDPNCKHGRMTIMACIQTPLNVDWIEASINIKIMKSPHGILAHLVDLEN